MNKNNFDMSSTGVDVEITIFYDCELARLRFKENFELVEKDIYFFTDGSLEVPVYLEDVIDIPDTKANRKRLAKWYVQEGIFETIKEALEYFEGMEFYIIMEEVTRYYPYYDLNLFEKAEEIVADLGLKGVKFLYGSVNTRGYCQGDYAIVYFYKESAETFHGEYVFQEFIDKSFWDCPLYFKIEVNGEEFYPASVDAYGENYDKGKVIEEVCKNFSLIDTEVLRQELENLLPDDLSVIEYE